MDEKKVIDLTKRADAQNPVKSISFKIGGVMGTILAYGLTLLAIVTIVKLCIIIWRF